MNRKGMGSPMKKLQQDSGCMEQKPTCRRSCRRSGCRMGSNLHSSQERQGGVSPLIQHGRPVRVWVSMPIRFKREQD
jgi:hypothetical protein